MEIQYTGVPLLLQAVRDGIPYKEILLKSETLKDVEEHEENLMYLDELLSYLTEEYRKNQVKFKLTPEQVLGERTHQTSPKMAFPLDAVRKLESKKRRHNYCCASVAAHNVQAIAP